MESVSRVCIESQAPLESPETEANAHLVWVLPFLQDVPKVSNKICLQFLRSALRATRNV